ncbi:MAG TPA: PrsW family intramembrane metalloprotease [Ignavibacteriaceae bacterium]
MFIAASALAAIIPMLSYLLIIWWADRYDREPFWLVLKNYLWGALGAVTFAIVWSVLISALVSVFVKDEIHLGNIETILVAPFVEEITKGAFLFLTIRNKKFDNITDGIVYGGAIGLGFGMTENFLYFITYGDTLANWMLIVIIRTLFSAVMHCVSTATFGAFIAYSRFKKASLKIFYVLTGLIIAIFIHLAWNLSVSFEQTTLLGFLFMIFTIALFISVFAISISGERKIIFIELFDEAQTGLIPMEHLHILNSPKRNRFGWVDESIRKLYIKAATTLAFRKMQLKNATGFSRTYYENDINYYRDFIRNLLSNSGLNK